MVKTVFKEIFTIILLGIVIVLLLGIVFYDYFPVKPVPAETTYTMSEEIKNEIKNEIQENGTEEVVIEPQLYELEDEDLDKYKKDKSYQPGRIDPYNEYEEPLNKTQEETITPPGDGSDVPPPNGTQPVNPGKGP